MVSINVILLLIIIILIIIIVVISIKTKKVVFDPYSDIYVYKENEFPLNVYFSQTTMLNQNYNLLYEAVKKAVNNFNETFNFKFFTINDNIYTYPNILTIQIACGEHVGCISKFDGSGGILAHATFPPYRKVCIDCKDITYEPLYLVLMHEFGHNLGLAHTEEKVPSLMNAYIDDKLTGFTDYDIKLIKRRFTFLK